MRFPPLMPTQIALLRDARDAPLYRLERRHESYVGKAGRYPGRRVVRLMDRGAMTFDPEARERRGGYVLTEKGLADLALHENM